MDNLAQARDLFPAAQKWIYLDHAATGSLARPVFEAVRAHLEDLSRNGCVNHLEWTRTIEETRSRCAELVRCAPQEIALTSSTSEGANIVARGLGFQRGDNIVIPDMEFPANVRPWQALQRDGVQLRVVPLDEGRARAGDILQRVDARTRLVAVSSVAYHNGYRIDLEALGAALDAAGVPMYVDAIQSLGALPMDVKACRAAFLSADSHKWLLGMEGAALFYCSAEWLERLRPPFVSWRSVADPLDFRPGDLKLAETCRRFEYAAYNLAGVHGFNAALGLLLGIGIDRIARRVLEVAGLFAERLEARGLEVLSPRGESERSGIVTFRYSGAERDRDYDALVAELQKRRVVVSARGGGIRVSPHFYNNEDDVDGLLEALP